MTVYDIIKFVGGLALFLFGMSYMGSSLEKLSGGKFESVLEKMTKSRLRGVLLGAGVTAIIQSSSAVTVMAVGFVNAKIMSLRQVIGIIMGANIGTTVTSWLLSLAGIESSNIFMKFLKPSSFSPIIAIIGILILIYSGQNEKKKNIASIMLGFTTLMIGMEYMSSATAGLKDVPEFTSILTMFSNPILGILAGALLTAIIQSSSASVGILQALSATGSITVSAAFPIILGQNIGTCITALLSSAGGGRNGKRTAIVHLAFNTIGVLLASIIFYSIRATLKLPVFEENVNSSSIAIIHTLFNTFSTIVLFPFGKQLEKLACLIIPNKEEKDAEQLIDKKFLVSNAYAIDKAKERCDDMANAALECISTAIDIVKKYSTSKAEKISHTEKLLDGFEDELETYFVNLYSGEMDIVQSSRLSMLSHAVGAFERMGDYANNILKIKKKMHKNNIHFSSEASAELEVISAAVKEITENTVRIFIKEDTQAAGKIEALEQVIDNLKTKIKSNHSQRMENKDCTVENGLLFLDIINSLERIADHCSNLSLCVIELSHNSYRTHSQSVNLKNNVSFMKKFDEYSEKYSLV